MQNPLNLTEDTFQKGLPVTPPVTPAGPAGGGGLGNDLESLMNFIERVLPRIESFMTQFQQARGMETGAVAQPQESTPQPAPAGWKTPETPAPTGPPRLDAAAVYNKLLGALNNLPPEMTVAEALDKAKKGKAMVIPLIQAEIDKLYQGQ